MQICRPRAIASAAVVAAALTATSGHAQDVTFKNFRRYPTTGQWQHEFVAYRDGKPFGAPTSTTSCTNPLDVKKAAAMREATAAMREAMKGVTGMCTAKVLTDKESLAESETVCKVGAGVQTMHMQMRAVDDRTIAVDERSTMPGMPETLTKSKSTYLGACTPGVEAAQARQRADSCAEIAKMRKDSEASGGAAQCAQLPEQYRAQCEAGMKMAAAMEQQCK